MGAASRAHSENHFPINMKTFSFIWTDKLGLAIAEAAPKRGYSMSLVSEDRPAVIAAVNQGIDSHLEACYVPARGDRFRLQTPLGIRGRISGARLALPSHREQSNVGLCASFMAELGVLSYMK